MIPKVSVIILNYNGLSDTLACLDSLFSTHPRFNFEVLVIDNGSDGDDSTVLRRKYGRRIRLFPLPKNLGFTGGNNFAAKQARGKYLFLLNNDTTIIAGCMHRLTAVLEKHSQVAVVQPKIKWSSDPRKFDYAGACGGLVDKYGYPFTRGRIFETQEDDLGQYDSPVDIFWASGAAMMIRTSIIKKLDQLFDNMFFNYMEEIDFCWRIQNLSYKIKSIPSAVVYHKVAATAQKNLVKKRFWEHRNNLLLLLKNLSATDLIPVFVIRVPLELATYFHYLVSGQFKNSLSLLLAHLHFLWLAPGIILKRQNSLLPLKLLPIYPGSISWDYFLRRKTRFSQLNWT